MIAGKEHQQIQYIQISWKSICIDTYTYSSFIISVKAVAE